MNRKHLVIKMLNIIVSDDDPIIYQYIKGGKNSKNTAIKRLTEVIYEYCNEYWFGDKLMTISYVRGVVREYLMFMEELYKNGEIKLKSIYHIPQSY